MTYEEIENQILVTLHNSDKNMRGSIFTLSEVFQANADAPNQDNIAKIARDMQDRGLLQDVDFGFSVRGAITLAGHKEAEQLISKQSKKGWAVYEKPIDGISWYNTNSKLGSIEKGLMLKLRYAYQHTGEYHERVFLFGDATFTGRGGFEHDFGNTIFVERYFGPEIPAREISYIVHVVAENRDYIETLSRAAESIACTAGKLPDEETAMWRSMLREVA